MTVRKKAEPVRVAAEAAARPQGISVEMALYIGVGLLAALTRLWALDAWPLRADEAAQAMGAWNLARGSPADVAAYSPLLMTGNLLLFGLFRASDAVARLWPAVFGVLTALTPALLRSRLGRPGALVAALLLALSPTLMFASRSLDGRIVAVEAGFVLLVASVRLIDTGDRRNLVLAVAALAVGLLSAPLFYTVLVILLTGVAILWLLRGPLELDLDVTSLRARWHDLRSEAGLWSRLSIIFAATLLVLGTGFVMNLDGLGAGADLIAGWLSGFAWNAGSLSPVITLWGLALYESLALLFGVAGLVVGWKRHDSFALLLGWWAMTGLVISLAAGGWQPVDLILLAVPLGVLAGKLIGELLETVSAEPLADGEWLILGLSVLLGTFGYFSFAQYSRDGRQLFAIIAGVLVPVVFLAVAGYLAVALGWRRALRGAGLALAMCILAVTISTAWHSNHSSDIVRYDLLAMDRTEPGVRDLLDTMNRYSVQQMRSANVAPVLVVGEQLSWLQWELRAFRDVTFVDTFAEVGADSLVITPAGVEPALGEQYSGQDMYVQSSWRPTGLTGQYLAKWLILRKPPLTMTREAIILWAPRPVQ